MVTDFIKLYANLIVDNPDAIEVTLNELDENFYEIVVTCVEEDLGKLIGKSGNMINSLKTIINGCKAKDGKAYKIQIVSN